METRYTELVNMVMVCKPGDTCVVWPYNTSESGHGIVKHPILKRNISTSRASFEIWNGFLPPVVRHTCDNPPCINPYHLIPGTHVDNVADRVERNRSAHGINHGRAKLNEADVVNIFISSFSVSKLALIYNVDQGTIRRIKDGRTWSHITNGF